MTDPAFHAVGTSRPFELFGFGCHRTNSNIPLGGGLWTASGTKKWVAISLTWGCEKSTVVVPLELLLDPPLELLLDPLLLEPPLELPLVPLLEPPLGTTMGAPLDPPLGATMGPPLDPPLDPEKLTVPPELLVEATVAELWSVVFPQPASAVVMTRATRAKEKFRLSIFAPPREFIPWRMKSDSSSRD